MFDASIERYAYENKNEWNDFLTKAKNSHFFFNRNYMDYHSDRFEDCSFIFRDDKSKIVAIFPANISLGTLYSHQGLTFGGLIVHEKIITTQVVSILKCLIDYCKKNGLNKILYKRMPDFYCDLHMQDDIYALFTNGFNLVRCDVNSTVSLQEPYSYSKGRKWSINKAKKSDIYIEESTQFSDFWPVLQQALMHHDVKPTHSEDEIKYLHSFFPSNIKLYLAKKGDEVLAGVVIFINKSVVHTQYMASTENGRQIGALDYLVHTLMTDTYVGKKYFNFGVSTEQYGKVINEGLLAQKNGFGAKTTVHQFYEIELS